jgi:hypothetical protein
MFCHQVLSSYRLSSDGMFDPFEVLAVGALPSRVEKSSKDVQRLAGVPIERIQLLIGHKNKSTTDLHQAEMAGNGSAEHGEPGLKTLDIWRMPNKRPKSEMPRYQFDSGASSGLAACSGSSTWARTRDLRINSPALYRLSYRGTSLKL